jgi:urease accessory protein
MLAATAAAPLGGDELDLTIDVGPDATARIGSIAAMVVWPSAEPAVSSLRTDARVGANAHLDLAPEPTITVAGSHHRSTTRVELAADATCRLVEEFSLGRSGEQAGTIEASLRVRRDGVALFHHDEVLGALAPNGTTSVGVGSARHVTTVVVVGAAAGGPATVVDGGAMAAWLPLADDAFAVLAVGVDRLKVQDVLARLYSSNAARPIRTSRA